MPDVPTYKPRGVTLRDPSDFPALRSEIFDKVKGATIDSFPKSYGGVRLEVADVDYEPDLDLDPDQQKQALLNDKFLTRKLSGTVRLFDEKSNELLDEQPQVTLMKVPWLSNRGTFTHNGSAYTCFLGPTQIWTEEGMMPISTIVTNRKNIRVWSWDFASNSLRLARVTSWFKKTSKAQRMCFEAPMGLWPSVLQGRKSFSTVWCTPEHRFFDSRGNKCEAQHVKGVTMLEERMSSSQRQMVLGTLLGDGTIQAPGCLRFTHCKAQHAYIDFKRRLMGTCVAPQTKLRSAMYKSPTSDNVSEQFLFSACDFGEMKELRLAVYPHGVRCLDTDWFKECDERALAIWFCDDGSARYIGDSTCPEITLHTQNFTSEDIDKLVDWLSSRWGLHAHIARNTGNSSISGGVVDLSVNRKLILGAEHGWRFLELVAPYMHECLRYKALRRPRTIKCARGCGRDLDPVRKVCSPCYLAEVRSCKGALSKSIRYRFGKSAEVRALAESGGASGSDTCTLDRWSAIQAVLGSGVLEMERDNKAVVRLREVPVTSFDSGEPADYSKRNTVYDIEVEGTHNYFANGVLVSNCINQLRLLPGLYGRFMDNGHVEVHANMKPGTGSSWRVRLEPDTAQFRLGVGPQSQVHLYSVLKDLGVGDDDLKERWGEGTWQKNAAAYNPRALAQAYKSLVPRRAQEPDADRPRQIEQVKEALGRGQVLKHILQRNMSFLFDQTKAASLKLETAKAEADEAQDEHAAFKPDLTPDDMREAYNSIYGKHGPRLASMQAWPDEWINKDEDPLGWLEWYDQYHAGRRIDDDRRQIRRWQGMKRRHGAQYVANPTPRRGHALRNWAVDPLKLLPEEARGKAERDMNAYREQAWTDWAAKKANLNWTDMQVLASHLNQYDGTNIDPRASPEDLAVALRDTIMGGALSVKKAAALSSLVRSQPDLFDVELEDGCCMLKSGALKCDITNTIDFFG